MTEDCDLRDRFREYRTTQDRVVRNELIEAHRWIAVRCARRFEGRGEPLDDLIQVAQLGVLKSVERFDPDRGVAFASFAVPTVLGELRRHFRDTTWSVRVPRRMKEMHVAMGSAVEELVHTHGRHPRIEEIAARLQVSVDEVLDALEAGNAYRAGALSRVDGTGDDSDIPAVGGDDQDLERAIDRMAVRRLMKALTSRERSIVYLHYFGGLSQEQIAARVGVSQVHVSRLLRASLERMRNEQLQES
jgi:RNA polymerase sigma-B factor